MKDLNIRKSVHLALTAAVVLWTPKGFSAGGRTSAVTVTSAANSGSTAGVATGGTTALNQTNTTVNTTNTNAGVSSQQSGVTYNMANQAQGASGGQRTGMIIGAASAGFCAAKAIAACAGSPDPSCPGWILGAVASGAVAMKMAAAKQQSDQSFQDATSQGRGGTSIVDPAKKIVDSNLTQSQANLNTALSNKPNASASIKNGTVQLPDGRKINVNSLTSPSAAAAAGLTPGEYKDFQSALSAGLKEGEKVAKGMDSSAGAGDGELEAMAGGLGKSNATLGADGSAFRGSSFGLGTANRDPAQVAGMVRNFNGEPIAVASENIFTLITRRIDLHARKGNLLTP